MSLGLSKAFDRDCWPSLWQALASHGLSVVIAIRVQQGCVLSPKFFCYALQWAIWETVAMHFWTYGSQTRTVGLQNLRQNLRHYWTHLCLPSFNRVRPQDSAPPRLAGDQGKIPQNISYNCWTPWRHFLGPTVAQNPTLLE